jgi:hypothetical protein
MTGLAAADHDSAREALEAQLRECFGRVVYTHKAHEKDADISLAKLGRIKVAQIILSAITTAGLVAVIFGPADKSSRAAWVAALISAVLLSLNTYTKDSDPGQTAQKHKDAAVHLWDIRESYLSLLTDLKAGIRPLHDACDARDRLQKELAAVYASAPRTTPEGYARASKALKVNEDLTFSDAEIDQFLPAPLRKLLPPVKIAPDKGGQKAGT